MSLNARRVGSAVGLLGLHMALIGCVPQSLIYAPEAVLHCDRIAVMPFVDAPGHMGRRAGIVESGVVLSELSRMDAFDVEGAARLRKALHSSSAGTWDMAAQRRLTDSLDIDLVMVGEVTDYRFTKEAHTIPLMVASHTWTETICWVGVNLRLVDPDSGQVVYAASGSGKSNKGYGPAMLMATRKSLKELQQFLQTHTPKEVR